MKMLSFCFPADDITQECKKKGLEDSFIKDISDYYKTQMKQRPVKVPNCRYVEVSKLSAVEIPKAGMMILVYVLKFFSSSLWNTVV